MADFIGITSARCVNLNERRKAVFVSLVVSGARVFAVPCGSPDRRFSFIVLWLDFFHGERRRGRQSSPDTRLNIFHFSESASQWQRNIKTHSRRLVVIPRSSKSPCFHAAVIFQFFFPVFFFKNGREKTKPHPLLHPPKVPSSGLQSSRQRRVRQFSGALLLIVQL